MQGRNTRDNLEVYAKENGLEPVQLDGIPEGFSFKSPDIDIGGIKYIGTYHAFVPNSIGELISENAQRLLELYKEGIKQRDGKRN